MTSEPSQEGCSEQPVTTLDIEGQPRDPEMSLHQCWSAVQMGFPVTMDGSSGWLSDVPYFNCSQPEILT